MNRKPPPRAIPPALLTRRPLRAASCALVVACALLGPATLAAARAPVFAFAAQPPGDVSATLSECVVPAGQGERYATFAAEMTAPPGAGRMQMRFEVQVRLPGEALFHAIVAPGLGAWRTSDASVHVYRYVRQVTNLTAPAVYRALVHFRWLTPRGSVIRRAERITPRCAEPAPEPVSPAAIDRLRRSSRA